MELVDPKQIFRDAKKAADDARAQLEAERDKLKADHKLETAKYHERLKEIDTLLRVKKAFTRKPKPVEAVKASA